MDRAEFLRRVGTGTAGLALAASVLGHRSATAQATKPNVLLIMTDDQPYHTIGTMEALQNRVVTAGMRFNNGYVATPICGPARGSVLTGKWSHNTGLEGTNTNERRPEPRRTPALRRDRSSSVTTWPSWRLPARHPGSRRTWSS